MNRSASAAYYPFQVMPRFLLGRQGEVYYIGGSDILPPPLETQREARILEKLGTPEEKEAKSTLIEHNLRLVVYIAKKFDNTGVSVEDLISIGTIGLIKAINTFNPVKNIKLVGRLLDEITLKEEILSCLAATSHHYKRLRRKAAESALSWNHICSCLSYRLNKYLLCT